MMSTEGSPLPQPRSSRWLLVFVMLVVAFMMLVAGIAIGVGLDRFVLPHRPWTSSGSTNPNVTKDNYVKIKPEMTSWEVSDILGSGEIVREEGFIVDAAGNYKKYGPGYQETGTVSPHNGKPSQEIKQEVVWRNGEQAIRVTFLSNKAVSKKEDRLFH